MRAADALAKLCGYLPQALRTAASALAERRTLAMDDYIRRLADARERLEWVDASLALSYDLLDAEMQAAWRCLAVFPDEFDAPAAAAVWEVGEDVARRRLEELERFSLVEWRESSGRFWLHDLVRVFVDSRLGEDERIAAQRRHVEHYSDIIEKANQLLLKGGEESLRGLALFDMERTNIEVGWAWTAMHTNEDDAAAQACNRYAWQGSILGLRLHPRENICWLEAALAAARRLKQREAEGIHLGNLGSAYHALGEYRRAIEYHEQDLTIAREIGDRRGEGQALGNLGIAYDSLGEYRRAIEFLEQHLTIAREIGDRRDEGMALGNLGSAYGALGEHRRVIEYQEQDLVIARQIGDRRGEGQALGNLGLAYRALGEYRRAIEFHEQGLTIARQIGDRLGEGQALGNLGAAYHALGEKAKAIACGEAALEIFTAIESPNAQAVRDLLAKWRGQKYRR